MTQQAPSRGAEPTCDCCGTSVWRYVLTESDIDLGRCAECGLHYVAPMRTRAERIAEMESGHFAGDHHVVDADSHDQAERLCQRKFQRCVALLRRFAPPGKLLDIGCGTGTLINLARQCGIEAEGIELTPDRLKLARELTGAAIYDQPIEMLGLASGSLAAVTMIDVFSHLTSPAETFSHIRRVLCSGGILLLRTGEIGPGVRKRHQFVWDLGDHLYFLGDDTIERYADRLGFELVHRETAWSPATTYTRERFNVKGRSAFRNFMKGACLYTPGVFPVVRWYMLNKHHADNPCYVSVLVMKKTDGNEQGSARPAP